MENKEIEVFKQIKDNLNIVFDVGARTDLIYHEIHPNCEYHLFEPNNEFVEILEKKINSPNIFLNPIGLSDKIENDCIYYENVQSFIMNPLVKSIDNGHRFNLTTLDSYVNDNKIKKIDFLKIDCEGLDYQILKGGEKTINSGLVNYIQVEYWDNPNNFFNLLNDKYDMYLILENEIIKHMPTPLEKFDNLPFTIKLNINVIELIHTNLINKGMGGNLFCVNKNLLML